VAENLAIARAGALFARLSRCNKTFRNTLVPMMFLLHDLLGVRDGSWISHQFIDGSQKFVGRIWQRD
jgi:hypothetical protein